MNRLSFVPHEIVATFVEHTRTPRQDQLDALAAKGVAARGLAGAPGSGEFVLGFGRTSPAGAYRFDFDPAGVASMCVVALDAFSEAADIVAWRAGTAASWLGRCSYLGAPWVDASRFGEALAVFPTLVDWMKGERRGVLLVDRPRAARELRDCGPFLATGGMEHAAQLVAMLTAPPPKVRVPDPMEGRRAA